MDKFGKMKRLLFFTVFLIACSNIKAQQAMTFQAGKEAGIEMKDLDANYTSPLDSDSASAAIFGVGQEQYIKLYQEYLGELGQYLSDQGFKWERPRWCFNKIYFNEEGRVDFFLYNFRPGEITDEMVVEFQKHLENFVKDSEFPTKPNSAFSQCSPVTYVDPKE